MADGEPIGLLLVLTYATYVAPSITYTGVIDLTVRARDLSLDVQGRDYSGLSVLARDFDLLVEDR